MFYLKNNKGQQIYKMGLQVANTLDSIENKERQDKLYALRLDELKQQKERQAKEEAHKKTLSDLASQAWETGQINTEGVQGLTPADYNRLVSVTDARDKLAVRNFLNENSANVDKALELLTIKLANPARFQAIYETNPDEIENNPFAKAVIHNDWSVFGDNAYTAIRAFTHMAALKQQAMANTGQLAEYQRKQLARESARLQNGLVTLLQRYHNKEIDKNGFFNEFANMSKSLQLPYEVEREGDKLKVYHIMFDADGNKRMVPMGEVTSPDKFAAMLRNNADQFLDFNDFSKFQSHLSQVNANLASKTYFAEDKQGRKYKVIPYIDKGDLQTHYYLFDMNNKLISQSATDKDLAENGIVKLGDWTNVMVYNPKTNQWEYKGKKEKSTGEYTPKEIDKMVYNFAKWLMENGRCNEWGECVTLSRSGISKILGSGQKIKKDIVDKLKQLGNSGAAVKDMAYRRIFAGNDNNTSDNLYYKFLGGNVKLTPGLGYGGEIPDNTTRRNAIIIP